MHDPDIVPKASGLQIAFLIFAVALLAVPAAQWLVAHSAWARENESLIGRLVMFSVAIGVLAGVPATRRMCARMLARPISPSRRAEVCWITLVAILGNFAIAGGVVAGLWIQGGDAALASQSQIRSDAALSTTASVAGLSLLLLSWVIGPVVEELVFRGFLYRAWERRWSWLPATLLTAAVFGVYHPFFVASFCYSVLFTCVIRRTSSLRSAIVVHAISNVSLWGPFLGQFILPVDASGAGLSAWWFHLACLFGFIAFLPVYVWQSRDHAS